MLAISALYDAVPPDDGNAVVQFSCGAVLLGQSDKQSNPVTAGYTGKLTNPVIGKVLNPIGSDLFYKSITGLGQFRSHNPVGFPGNSFADGCLDPAAVTSDLTG